MSAANGTRCSASSGTSTRSVISAGSRRTTAPSSRLAESRCDRRCQGVRSGRRRGSARCRRACCRWARPTPQNAPRRVITIAVVGCPPRPATSSIIAAFGRKCVRHGAEVRCDASSASASCDPRDSSPSRAYAAGHRGAARAPALRELERRRDVPRGRDGAQHRCRAELRVRRIDRTSETRARAACCRSIHCATNPPRLWQS